MNHETTTIHAMHVCEIGNKKDLIPALSESGDFGSGCGTTEQTSEGLRRNFP